MLKKINLLLNTYNAEERCLTIGEKSSFNFGKYYSIALQTEKVLNFYNILNTKRVSMYARGNRYEE